MTRLVCETLKLNCTFVPYETSMYGTAFDNGTGTGMIGAIQEGQFDTHLPNVNPNYARSLAVDFSHGYCYVDNILVTRASVIRPSYGWNVVYAFHWIVWCVFALALFVTAALIVVFVHDGVLNDIRLRWKPLYFTAFLFEIAIRLSLVNEHRKAFFRNRHTAVLSLFWGYGILVLASAYSGILFSEQIVTGQRAPFENFEEFIECVENGKCVVVTPLVSIASVQYLTAPGSPHAARFEKAFKENPIRVISKEEIAIRILQEPDVLFVWPTARNDISGYIDGKTRCSYLIAPMPQTAVGAFPIRKGQKKLLEALNVMASRTREYGLGFVVGLEPLDRPCSDTLAAYDAIHANKQLSLERSLKIPFYFYLIGMTTAIAIMITEVSLTKFSRWISK